MKKILFLLAMLPIMCYGQEYSNERKEYVRSLITREYDDFEDEIKIHNPLNRKTVIAKYIGKSGKTTTYLRLKTQGQTLNVRERGVTVIFDDGTKWKRNELISVEASDDGWDYSSFIELNSNDIKLFSTKKIKKYRLYIYDEEMYDYSAEEFMIAVGIVKDMK